MVVEGGGGVVVVVEVVVEGAVKAVAEVGLQVEVGCCTRRKRTACTPHRRVRLVSTSELCVHPDAETHYLRPYPSRTGQLNAVTMVGPSQQRRKRGTKEAVRKGRRGVWRATDGGRTQALGYHIRGSISSAL